ncbi:hypothetical protein HRbin02_01806 [Candidatus Calditenuaceae archaeon HR02]|nr:hypothetical protein HRbin02_01806 [Candidatus Calditenuaceae archaeon HR02]
MVEKAVDVAVETLIKPVLGAILEKAAKRRLTVQEASLILLYDMNSRLGRIEARLDSLDKRFESLEKRIAEIVQEIAGFRRDMAPLWQALAKLVEAQASKQ